MTTARIVKLGPGDHISLLIESATEVEGNYGKQARLDGQTAEGENVTLFVSLDTAVRQLERIGATLATIGGSIVKVEKVAKNGKTYTNIDRVGAATRSAPKAPPKDDPPVWLADQQADEESFVQRSNGAAGVERWFAHYDKCFAHAVELSRKVKGADTVVTLEGISAIAATLYIATKSAI